MSAETATQSFGRFRRCPPEIRRLIWAAALPDDDPPTVYIYIRSCIDCFYSKPYPIRRSLYVGVAIPEIFYVSREAHEAVKRWMKVHDFNMRVFSATGMTILTREWDVCRDTLYVAFYWFGTFLSNMAGYAHLFPTTQAHRNQLRIASLAIAAGELDYSHDRLGELLIKYPGIQTVYLVLGREPHASLRGPTRPKHDGSDKPWWEVEADMHLRWELEVDGVALGGEPVEHQVDNSQGIDEEAVVAALLVRDLYLNLIMDDFIEADETASSVYIKPARAITR